tara:strand:- start:245 stop:673 length:429 start_codon:yes stop_codon:yes gene_type:complete
MEPFSHLELAMREWARRFLKYSEITTKSTALISQKILSLHLYYNDSVPSQFSQIQQEIIPENSIYLYANNTLIGQIGGTINNEMTSVYIPTDDILVKWNHMEQIIRELIDAGYPGCVGCGGPGAEEEWDENKNRDYILKHLN